MQIVDGKLQNEGVGKNSNGGTEIMARRVATINPELLKEFQIVISRIEDELDPTKIRIYYAHDLPGDPASDHLKDKGWNKFHRIVFVSNWQMQRYIERYQIPWSRCIVLQNAIDPIPFTDTKFSKFGFKSTETIHLIYTPTPHRGLAILVPVFAKLCEKYDNIELDVFSSFALYGWEDRDKEFEPLYKQCKDHPKINYHGSKPNGVVRQALQKAHIFAYPSTWPETSCLCLIEAMSAGCLCVHANFAALPETAANWTDMYHFNEDNNEHAKILYTVLSNGIDEIKTSAGTVEQRLKAIKNYADIFYSWKPNRELQWNALLGLLLTTVKDRGFEVEKEMFNYAIQ
jgi:UDP-glucose:(glucosyl)LPS alpha-1,2-glucosyltransferase